MANYYLTGGYIFSKGLHRESAYYEFTVYFQRVAVDLASRPKLYELINHCLQVIRDLKKAFPFQFTEPVPPDPIYPYEVADAPPPANAEYKPLKKLNLSTLHKLGRLKI